MNHSVCIFVLFALLETVIGRPNAEQSESIEDKCIAETGIDPALLEKLPPTKDAPWDDGLKCFFACTLKKHGALKEDGSFDLEKTISEMPDDLPDEEKKKAIGAATACADKKGDNECETAHRIFMCLRDYTIAHLDDSDNN